MDRRKKKERRDLIMKIKNLKVKVFIDEYKYDRDKDELFIRLKIKDNPFVFFREIVIPLRGRWL